MPADLAVACTEPAVDFDCVGEWGAEISTTLTDGFDSQRAASASRSSPVGSDTGHRRPGATLREPHRDGRWRRCAASPATPNPYAAAYASTVAEAVTSGQPAIIFFATPAFCQTGFCGPTIELVTSVAREYEGKVAYVNVEPYQLHETVDGLRPALDADGHLQPVAAALDYGIPVEPYLFIVDAQGDVFAKFEGIVGGDELRAAIEDVLGGPDRGWRVVGARRVASVMLQRLSQSGCSRQPIRLMRLATGSFRATAISVTSRMRWRCRSCTRVPEGRTRRAA